MNYVLSTSSKDKNQLNKYAVVTYVDERGSGGAPISIMKILLIISDHGLSFKDMPNIFGRNFDHLRYNIAAAEVSRQQKKCSDLLEKLKKEDSSRADHLSKLEEDANLNFVKNRISVANRVLTAKTEFQHEKKNWKN